MRSNLSRKRYSSEICPPDTEILIQRIAVEIARWSFLINVVKGFDQRPQKIFLTSLIRKANNLIGKCIETAQFSEFAIFFLVYKVTFRKDLTR